MRTPADLALGQGCEPALDLVEPGSRSRCEVEVKAWMTCEPGAHGGRLVRSVVVYHQMNVEFGGNGAIDGAKEFQKLRAAMAPMQLTDDLPGGDIERGEQGGGSMAHVVV